MRELIPPATLKLGWQLKIEGATSPSDTHGHGDSLNRLVLPDLYHPSDQLAAAWSISANPWQ